MDRVLPGSLRPPQKQSPQHWAHRTCTALSAGCLWPAKSKEVCEGRKTASFEVWLADKRVQGSRNRSSTTFLMTSLWIFVAGSYSPSTGFSSWQPYFSVAFPLLMWQCLLPNCLSRPCQIWGLAVSPVTPVLSSTANWEQLSCVYLCSELWYGRVLLFLLHYSRALPKSLPGLRDAPASASPQSWLLSSTEPCKGLAFSSASFVQHWGVKGKRWAAAGWGEDCQGQGFEGQLSWDRSAAQAYDCSGRSPEYLWVSVLCLPLPRPLVTCLLSPPFSLLISLMTLGFHTALRAAKACSVRVRKVFLFPQSLFYISVDF